MGKRKKKVIIQPIGKIKREILLFLKEELEKKLSFSFLVYRLGNNEFPLDLSEYDSSKNQYNGSKTIIRLYNHLTEENAFRILGIMDEDVYARDLNFIFGIATRSKNPSFNSYGAALISLKRLHEDFYGRAKDPELFRKRVLKEAVHELGHTFGLDHCGNYCVMRFSDHLLATDEKPINFCSSCRKQLQSYFQKF